MSWLAGRLKLDILDREGDHSARCVHRATRVKINLEQVRYHEEHSSYNKTVITTKAPYVLGLGPEFRFLEEGTFRSWIKQFSWYQDIEIGAGDLDHRLTIKGKPPEWVQIALKPQQWRLRKIVDSYLTSQAHVDLPFSDGENVVASLASFDSDFDIDFLKVFISFVTEVAHCDFYGWSTLLSLEGAQSVKDTEFPLMARIKGRANVDFAPIAADGEFKTMARAVPNQAMERRSINLQDAAAASQLKMHDVANLLAKIGRARIEIEKDIRLIWPKVIRSEERLWAGAHLLQRIANQHSGVVFR